MVVQTQIIGDITYSSTTSGTSISLSDGDFSNVQALGKLADAINRLADRIHQ